MARFRKPSPSRRRPCSCRSRRRSSIVADRKLRAAAGDVRGTVVVAAVVLLGATIFLLRSVAHGQASVLVPIAQMGFIVAALLGIFVLRERVTLRKAVGLAAALAALTVLAAS